MYDTVEEIKQKLIGSVVLFDGHPVLLKDAEKKKSSINLFFYRLPISRTKTVEAEIVDVSDPKWDFRNFGQKLGYISIKNPVSDKFESLFITRVPVRHSRQGLDDKTTLITPCPEEGSYRFSWTDIVYNDTSTITNTVKNQFPGVESAFQILTKNKEFHSIPIHRKITFLYDQVCPPYLIYRSDKIGYSEDGKLFKLARHKEYLREELTDMIGLKIAER